MQQMCTKLMINDIEIEKVKEHTFLGVIINEKLYWKPHIHHIQAKISKINCNTV